MKDANENAKSKTPVLVVVGVCVLLFVAALYLYVSRDKTGEIDYGAEGNLPQGNLAEEAAPKLYLKNCLYDTASELIICDTNCVGSPGDGTSMVVFDKAGNMSMAIDSQMRLGTIEFSEGIVIAGLVENDLVGSVRISQLDMDAAQWVVSLACKNPEGGVSDIEGVLIQ